MLEKLVTYLAGLLDRARRELLGARLERDRVDRRSPEVARGSASRSCEADAWQVSLEGTQDYVTPEGIRVAPALELLGTLV